jgi:hypothetical protein
MYSSCLGGNQDDGGVRMSKLLGLLLIVFAGLVSACRPEGAGAGGQPSAVPMPTVAVTVQIVTAPEPTPTPATCTSLPAGMTLSVKPVSATSVQVEIKGLEPGEKLIFIAHAETSGYRSRIEGLPVAGADSDGHFVYQMGGLGPLPGSTRNQWQIQIIHARGVACTDVTLP